MTSLVQKPAKAIIFARMSSEGQKDGHSLNAQSRHLHDYCNRMDFDIINEYQFIDSPKKFFLDMIGLIKTQKEKVVLVVYSVDRLCRGFAEFTLIDKLIKNNELEVHFYKENFVISKNFSAADVMRWNFINLLGQTRSKAISDNVKRSFTEKLKNGEWIGKAPFGYKNVTLPNGKKDIVVDNNEAQIVKRIFTLYLDDISIKDIAQKVGLSISQIRKIFNNEFYCGEMFSKKYNKYYPHRYERIVSQDIFNYCFERVSCETFVHHNRNSTIVSDELSLDDIFLN